MRSVDMTHKYLGSYTEDYAVYIRLDHLFDDEPDYRRCRLMSFGGAI